MLDRKWVREHADAVRRAAEIKRIGVDVDAYFAADEAHRSLLQQVENLRGELKAASKLLGKMSAEERAGALDQQKAQKAQLKDLEGQEAAAKIAFDALAALLPTPPADDVPVGKDDTENVEITSWGKVPEFDFDILDHVALGEKHGMIDIPRGVALGGSRNYLLLGDGALLERAVLQMAVDHMQAREFELVSVPTLVLPKCMEGTGYFPGGEDQAYMCERDDLALVGTSEVPLTSIHAGEVLSPEQVPLRRIAVSPCYRREAGTYGKDTKGLYRVHQFWKCEQVVIGPADEAWSLAEHKRMLAHATDFMQLLELPYRVVNVCSGDLGQGQVQKFDIETWMPSRNSYGETHSASRFHDFQSRRLNLRYRNQEGKPVFCHTLNNTVIASPRVLIALIENHQQADGSIRIPEALQPYLGGRKQIG
ncbi:MAG: serine--tRNA ligase [Planctomycetes bacterium]|jgi:seryl-tRNA synthetase|nr:serine--tRNA ligase [Planctomycetota bacterium]MBT4029705.1 serine--tRNA ligase [Planctomycetota bacterium]MBT4561205.1 serine--tRNA ligase [Planctomycetota bacterium]MBT7011782.1 serine--tRNA ligase [Planctomycetota bacterium]MBT7319569.1 serine--tRNA ligase [Planctomycetota bacterium]